MFDSRYEGLFVRTKVYVLATKVSLTKVLSAYEGLFLRMNV